MLGTTHAAVFNSAQTGNWTDDATWIESGTPAASDTVFIHNGHVVTFTSTTAYTHTGNLQIEAGGELVASTGDADNGFTFNGGEFHVFGEFELTFPDKDLTITGNSLFWAHDGAVIIVSDDWIISGNSTNIIEKICLEVDDDFIVDGTGTTLCGDGGISIGNITANNTLNFNNSATAAQICNGTIVYRGPGGSCLTPIQTGTGNGPPEAFPDSVTILMDGSTSIDVLDFGRADSDPDGDPLTLSDVGTDGFNGNTLQGGTININDNGTPGIPGDDFVDYTAPIGFTGRDSFLYYIDDGNGAVASAYAIIIINAALPVELTAFQAQSIGCKVALEWTTASEENNDYFELERSLDGQFFQAIGRKMGNGNTTTHRYYQWIDETPAQLNYYRLKQVDFDGKTDYSDVISVSNDCAADQSKRFGIQTVFPNPIQDNLLSIKVNADTEEAPIVLSNQSGQVLRVMNLPLNIGLNTLRIDIADLPGGIYFLKMGRSTARFTRMRE